MKYIIVEEHGIEVPIIFSELLSHQTVARQYHDVISAGFCSFSPNGDYVQAFCYGESISLKKKSRNEDSEIVEKHLTFRG